MMGTGTRGSSALRLAAATAILVLGPWGAHADAATPRRITLSGPGLDAHAEITRPADLATLVADLCTEIPAGRLAGRPSSEIAIAWTTELTWRGRFFPAVAGGPAAVDIPAWTLYRGTRIPGPATGGSSVPRRSRC